MVSESVELSRLRMENATLAFENARLATENSVSNRASEVDANKIRSLRKEINSLNLQLENVVGNDVKVARLERENRKLRDQLAEIEERAETEKMRRERMESNLSEVEEDNTILRDREARQWREKQKLKSKLSETKSSLHRVSMSQESLESRIEHAKREYSKAEKEFQKLEDSIWAKRTKRRRRAYEISSLLSCDSDSDDYAYKVRSSPRRRHYYFYNDF